MGNKEHMEIARRGVEEWNAWRADNLRVQPDLTRVDLSGHDLTGVDFRGVGLFKADLSGARLVRANLRQSILIKTDFTGADLTAAWVYGASVWDVRLEGAVQHDLVITEPGSASVAIDNLEVAQFVYLLMANARIRDVVDTVTSKLVLLLGRFTGERKKVLDQLKQLAREAGLVPVLFDFDGPRGRNTTETVRLLAHLARFVIADLTSPMSVPHELASFVPDVRVPVVPLILAGSRPYSMFADLHSYPWVLPLHEYRDLPDVAARVFPAAVEAADRKLAELRPGWAGAAE